MKIEFYHAHTSMKEMLQEIARNNRVKSFNVDIYEQRKGDSMGIGAINRTREHQILNPNDLHNREFSELGYSDGKRVIGINSFVTLEQGEMHLRQLDIDRLPRNIEDALDQTRIILNEMYGEVNSEKNGFLIESSPDNYHFCGKDLLTQSQFDEWIQKTRTSSKESIRKWAEFQKNRNYSVLRLTSSDYKPHAPQVRYRVQIK